MVSVPTAGEPTPSRSTDAFRAVYSTDSGGSGATAAARRGAESGASPRVRRPAVSADLMYDLLDAGLIAASLCFVVWRWRSCVG